MRKLLDEIVWQLLMFCIKYLFRYYDIFVDGVQLWLEERFPPIRTLKNLIKLNLLKRSDFFACTPVIFEPSDKFVSPAGNRIHIHYEPRFDGERTILVECGSSDIQDSINSFAPYCDIEYMLSRLRIAILLYYLPVSPCLAISLLLALTLLTCLILSILPNLISLVSLPKSVKITITIFVCGLVLCFGTITGLLAVLLPFSLILHLIL